MQNSLALDPYNFRAHFGLARLFTNEKKWTEARQQLEFVRQYFPDEDAAIYPCFFRRTPRSAIPARPPKPCASACACSPMIRISSA